LVQQPQVDQDPDGHEGVYRRLKLDQQVDVEPLPLPLDPPDHVAFAALEIMADVAGRELLQGRKVEILHPLLGDETLEEVSDHLGMGEQQLVAVVVVRHRTLSCRAGRKARAFLSGTRLKGKVDHP